MEGMSPQRGKNTNKRQWEKYFKITNKASESCCEPRTFAGIIRVHWLQSTLALSQMAPTTIHLLFWFICWYIVESNTSFSHFLFVLAGLRHLHLDFWARELHPHTNTGVITKCKSVLSIIVQLHMDDIIFAVYMHVGGWRRVCFHHLVDEFPALKHLLRVNVFDCLSALKPNTSCFFSCSSSAPSPLYLRFVRLLTVFSIMWHVLPTINDGFLTLKMIIS